MDLPKPTFEIHSGEVCHSSHTFQCFLYSGKRVGVLLCPRIKSSKVNAEPEGTIFSSLPVLRHYTKETGLVE